ncbi:hypothetical protein E2562_037773 [Oryza meyeriana var. granulata]|uniref:Uncharacterized protein n=1 Tax=Oryza meyeriana var. granulata TaxID=110450 RepID=A0A6G1CW71_9ORYZ|nr:hypothetical protein E2562_037773 [Oryza meyeriana var. granulata]
MPCRRWTACLPPQLTLRAPWTLRPSLLGRRAGRRRRATPLLRPGRGASPASREPPPSTAATSHRIPFFEGLHAQVGRRVKEGKKQIKAATFTCRLISKM